MKPTPAEIATGPTRPDPVAILLVPLAALSFLAILVYVDATRKNMDAPIKWAIAVLATGGVGIFIYLYERSDSRAGPDPEELAGPRTLPGGSNRQSDDE